MDCKFWVGNYGNEDQETLIQIAYSAENGFKTIQAFIGLSNPSYVLPHPSRRVIYTVQENEKGVVCAWSLDGEMITMRSRMTTEGSYPCHLALSPDAGWLYTANYGSGSVACFRIPAKNGNEAISLKLLYHPGHES